MRPKLVQERRLQIGDINCAEKNQQGRVAATVSACGSQGSMLYRGQGETASLCEAA